MVFKCKIIFRFFSVTIGNIIKVVFGHISKVINGLRPVNLKDYQIKSGNDRDGKCGKSVDNYKCVVQCGRSMIEILGVLAIIAVLSVGGISGYSKAMTMFKINKWKENFAMMMINLKTSFANSRNYNTAESYKNIVNLLKEINVIPTDMLDSENKDLFGNELSVYSPRNIPDADRFTVRFLMPSNKESVEVCKAFFSFVPEFKNMWTANLNDDLKIGFYELCGSSVPADIAKSWNCKYYSDELLSQIAQKCAICSQYSCDLKLIINNGN